MNNLIIKNKNIEAVIFDIDGTILDSTGIWYEVDKAFFKKRGMDVPPDYVEKIGHIGLNQAAIYTKETYHLEESLDEIINEWLTSVKEFYKHHVDTKPHVIEFIKILKEKNIPICCATANNTECYINGLGKHQLLEYFNFILEVDQSENKSSPKIYFDALTSLKKINNNINVSNCLVIEDLNIAVKTAHMAGFITCGVYDKGSLKYQEDIKNNSDFYIKDFNELIKLIK